MWFSVALKWASRLQQQGRRDCSSRGVGSEAETAASNGVVARGSKSQPKQWLLVRCSSRSVGASGASGVGHEQGRRSGSSGQRPVTSRDVGQGRSASGDSRMRASSDVGDWRPAAFGDGGRC
ncbi:hypothetical protein ACJRO7_031681 [Eucalyptus globulus]|uniref:Uncharacterized protein n=1 Tax=Eucalyptus globulus TaxID=34317 RepID=A0ABD3JKX7_EUCGL